MKKQRKKNEKTGSLLSNCWFLMKAAFRLEPALFWTRVPFIVVNAATPFIPILFVRTILNGILEGETEKQILLYVLTFSLATFLGKTLEQTLRSRSDIRMEMAMRKMKDYLGKCVTCMPYGEAEQPKVRDFVHLAKEGAGLSDIFGHVVSILTGILTLAGAASIVILVQPLIFLLILAVVGVRLLADRRNLKLWEKWRPAYAPVMRKGNYLIDVMRGIAYGKEVRLNHLEDWLDGKLGASFDGYLKVATGHNIALQRNNAFPELAAILQECAAYLILAYRVVFEGMLIGDFSMYMTSINTFSDKARQIVYSFSELVKSGLFAQDFRYCVEHSGYGRGEDSGQGKRPARNGVGSSAQGKRSAQGKKSAKNGVESSAQGEEPARDGWEGAAQEKGLARNVREGSGHHECTSSEIRRSVAFDVKPSEYSRKNGEPLVLEFRKVSFRYPKSENFVLKEVSLTLREGESLSIVGVNGAGKTTFIKLLCRLYEPTEGEILLNGADIAEIPYPEYVRQLGVVFQDFRLFAFSMEENITMGMSGGGRTIEDCIDKCGLTEKYKSLPQGLQTNLSKEFDESGVEFSGGEGQKLALARVLYKNAPVIILDEPTAALDPLAEYELYRRFQEIVEGKCAVYISHRLSSTRFTDKIAVFHQGYVAEYGTHRELMEQKDGIYAALFRMQAQYYV
nr:ABC transporter ATP-binding protein [uncultured Acetatifactor sp.]